MMREGGIYSKAIREFKGKVLLLFRCFPLSSTSTLLVWVNAGYTSVEQLVD